MPNVLVVDDDTLVRWTLRERLQTAGHTVLEAGTGAEALERFREGVDLVLLDQRLPDINGDDVLRRLKAIDPEPPVILLTAHASVEQAVGSMKDGAFYYSRKSTDLRDVPLLVERALETTRMTRELRVLLAREREAYGLGGLIGTSAAIRAVKTLVRRVAARPTTVLLTGESGTGKDLVARALHAESARAGGPFLNITCSALPEHLLENELFGHERGAFTDAQRQKRGLLEETAGGTVFLDEIGEASPGAQAKLLRFLEEKAFRRLGGSTDIHADVRIIAATNRELGEAVVTGAFREDLLYRLAIVRIEMPSLRDHPEDLPILTDYFIQRFNKELGTQVTGVTDGVQNLLAAHSWPGNVRELKNALERAMLLFDCTVLDERCIQLARPARKPKPAFDLPIEGVDFLEIERELVDSALRRTRGNQSRAAALLHMTRDQIRHRMLKFNLTSGEEERDTETG
jgi:DNA-binding NtrC family response regulator